MYVQVALIFLLKGEGHASSLSSYISYFPLNLLFSAFMPPLLRNCSLLAYSCLPLLEYMLHITSFHSIIPPPLNVSKALGDPVREDNSLKGLPFS